MEDLEDLINKAKEYKSPPNYSEMAPQALAAKWLSEKPLVESLNTAPLSASYIYKLFKEWCSQNNIEKVPDITTLGRELKLQFKAIRRADGMYYMVNRQ